MKKTKWNNKWQGLSDMHAARTAARVTTMESTTMDQNTASVATNTVLPKPKTSHQNQQIWMADQIEMLFLSWRESMQNRQQRYLQPLSSMQRDMDYQSQTYLAAGGFTSQEQTPSSSFTEDSTENCAVLKQGPLEVKGNLTPSILTGDRPTTRLISSEDEEKLW